MPNQKITNNSHTGFGISAALTTPFGEDGSIDLDLALDHAGWLFTQGASSITLFGTTGEGASLGQSERLEMLDHMIAGEISPDQIIVTICASSIADAISQAYAALARGVKRLLVTPPFYFKPLSDVGLYTWFSSFAEAVSEQAPSLILYHIPQVTQVPLSVSMVQHLKDAHGDLVFGVKDSSGDWDNTVELLKINDLAVLVGDERLLAKAANIGAAGAISGMANLFPGLMVKLVETGETNPMINEIVNDLVQHPVTPAIKALVGEMHNAPEWRRARTPLESTPEPVIAALGSLLAKFNIQGLK